MGAIAYPATLPNPSTATVQPVERRELSVATHFMARALQRDRLATQDIVLPPFTDAQAQIFNDWWATSLYFGAAWFSATWPLPQGFVVGVRRILGQPKWRKQDKFWQVSFQCQVRGRGITTIKDSNVVDVLPMLFLFDFEEGGALTQTTPPLDHGGNGFVPQLTDGMTWGSHDPRVRSGTYGGYTVPKFGTYGLLNDYYSKVSGFMLLPKNNLFSFGSGDWQFDWFTRGQQYQSLGQPVEIFSIVGTLIFKMRGGSGVGYASLCDASGTELASGGYGPGSSPVFLNENTYYHFCIQRKSNVLRIWLNGIKTIERAETRTFAADPTIRFLYQLAASIDQIRGTTDTTQFFSGNAFTPPITPYARYV